MNKILIVIDMQNDFITGSLGSEMAQAIVPNVINKIEKLRKENYEIYFTRDTHDADYLNTLEGKYLPVEHCIFGTDGWRFPKELFSLATYIINKSTFGCNAWEIYLPEEAEVIEICGLCTDICVVTNALSLRTIYPDTKIICDASCCAGTTIEKHNAALDVMESCQIEVINRD